MTFRHGPPFRLRAAATAACDATTDPIDEARPWTLVRGPWGIHLDNVDAAFAFPNVRATPFAKGKQYKRAMADVLARLSDNQTETK